MSNICVNAVLVTAVIENNCNEFRLIVYSNLERILVCLWCDYYCWTCCDIILDKTMQDITSKETTHITKPNPSPTLHQTAAEELIINCRQTAASREEPRVLQAEQQGKCEENSPTDSNQCAAKETTKQQQLLLRSQSSKVIQQQQQSLQLLKQQQSLPIALDEQTHNHNHNSNTNNNNNSVGGNIATGINAQSTSTHHPSKSVSILVYKTLNTVFKNSRKIIFRVCEVASAKKTFTMFKFNKANTQTRAESRANACTGHDQFVRPPMPDKKVKHIMKKMHKQNGLKRSNSAIEFDVSALTAANRRHIYSSNRSASSEQDNSDQSEHSEKSPLVSARLDNLARIFFSKSMPAETGSRDTIDSVLTTRLTQ